MPILPAVASIIASNRVLTFFFFAAVSVSGTTYSKFERNALKNETAVLKECPQNEAAVSKGQATVLYYL